MSVAFTYTNPRFTFPRTYIKGFVLSAGCTNVHFITNQLHFDYLYPLYHGIYVVKSQFFLPNSNVYTLDWILDAAASQLYLSGSPIASSSGVAFYAMQTEQAWRIRLVTGLPVDETQTVDLSPLPSYWQPPL